MIGVSSLAVPYFQTPGTDVALNRLILATCDGNSKYIFTLKQSENIRRCTSIEKVQTTSSGHETHSPVSYIDNVVGGEVSPLLVRCGALNNKIKLNLSVNAKEDNLSKSLFIVKTRGDKSVEDVIKVLETNSKVRDIETSQVKYSQLPLDSNVKEAQRIIVNDTFTASTFANGVVCLYVFEGREGKFTRVFDVKFWVDDLKTSKLHIDTTTPEPKDNLRTTISPEKVDTPPPTSLQFGDYRNAFNFVLDDGPEFRTVLNKYEQLIPSIQKNTAALIEEVKSMNMNLKRLVRNKAKIYEIMKHLSNLNPILSRFKFKSDLKVKLEELFQDFETQLNFFLAQVCESKTLEKIKTVSTVDDEKTEIHALKKNFEHNSKEFYNWLKKYMSNEKERPESKLLLKRKKFELSKFDYMNHLNNFTNNQYINEFLENLFKFISIDIHDVSNLPKDLQKVQVSDTYKIFLNALLNFNTEKFKLRQMIESCRTNDELTDLIRFNNLTIENAINDTVVVTQDNVGQIFSPISSAEMSTSSTKSGDISESGSAEDMTERSGILYALGGKGKQGWHKEWVEVKNGQLKEFSDWRRGSDPINVPIQIALSNIKPTTHDKRQNCFEIFTSQGNKYIFQAMNVQERDKWIKTIDNARQNTEVFGNIEKDNNKTQEQHTHSKIGKKLLLKIDKPKVFRVNDNIVSPVSVKSDSLMSKNHHKVVRSIPDSDNHLCADCGSPESVEWVSVNFLVVLCINCSSFHRKMGSHISKIKSVKLDNFDKETEVLLGYINNRIHNGILEATLGADKAKITDYDLRLAFIQDKYIHKKYVHFEEDVNDVLLRSIQLIDLKGVIKYTLKGGDINSLVQLKNLQSKISLFEYSLRKALVVETDTGSEKLFVISQFLVLNGCKITGVRDIGVSEEAMKFWEIKYGKSK